MSLGNVSLGNTITIEVDVANTGSVDADEVVQIYAEVEASTYVRAPRELKAFGRFTIAAGQVRTCTIELPVDRLAVYDESRGQFILEPAVYDLRAAKHADDRLGPTVILRVR
jgi:beta-glucosidase